MLPISVKVISAPRTSVIFFALFVFLFVSSAGCQPGSTPVEETPTDPEDLFATYIDGPAAPILIDGSSPPPGVSWPERPSPRVDLTWRDNSDDEEGFVIERKEDDGGEWEEIGEAPVGTSRFSDTEVSYGMIYVYRVYAHNRYGNSGYTNEASAASSGDCRDCLQGGILALQENEPEIANGYFTLVSPRTSDYGPARYGMMLADLQLLARRAGSALNTAVELLNVSDNFQPAGSSRGMWEAAGDMLGPRFSDEFLGRIIAALEVIGENRDFFFHVVGLDLIEQVMRRLRETSIIAVQNGWTLEVHDFPLSLGEETDEVRIRISIHSGRQGELIARMIWLMADVTIGLLDYLSAHLVPFSFDEGMGLLNDFQIEMERDDFLGLIRSLGRLPADHPSFLKKNLTRWEGSREEVVETILEDGIANVKALARALEAAARPGFDTCIDAICLVDVDNNGEISSGDRVLIKGEARLEINPGLFPLFEIMPDQKTLEEIISMNETLAPLGVTMVADSEEGLAMEVDFTGDDFLALTGMIVRNAARIIESGVDIIDQAAVSLTAEDRFLSLEDLNPLFRDLSLPELPPSAKVNLMRLFNMPLGDLLTYYCEDLSHTVVDCRTGMPEGGTVQIGGAYPVSPIEVEMADVPGQCQAGWCGPEPHAPYYRQWDHEHFAGTEFAIPADGVSPVTAAVDAVLPPDTLWYIGLADPTLNGALMTDLSVLPGACASEGETGFVPADNYSLNKVLGCLQADFLPRLGDSAAYWEAVTWVTPLRALWDFIWLE